MIKSQKPIANSKTPRLQKLCFSIAGRQFQIPKISMFGRVGLAVVFLVGVGGLFFWKNQESIFRPAKSLPANILLLGYGGEGHEGANLTDTMMVAHLNIASKSAVLISVPRDVWVDDQKINAFFENSPQTAMDAVEKVTGLSSDKYVAVDFAGFVEMIDLIGGVDVKVETTFDDPEYPVAGKEDDPCLPCRYENLHFEAGVVHMDGQTALKFVRSRHSAVDGTDFGRSGRQRNLLLAVREKVLSLGILPQIPALYTKLRDHVQTNFTMEDLKGYLPIMGELLKYKIMGIALTDENVLQYGWSDDGQMILAPRTGDWEETKRWILTQL